MGYLDFREATRQLVIAAALQRGWTYRRKPRLTGVYFLIQRREIVYVGCTTDLYGRLRTHSDNGFEFESVAFVPVPEDHQKFLVQVEQFYMRLLSPRLNRPGNRKRTGPRGELRALPSKMFRFARSVLPGRPWESSREPSLRETVIHLKRTEFFTRSRELVELLENLGR